jgi:hypothetical protein
MSETDYIGVRKDNLDPNAPYGVFVNGNNGDELEVGRFENAIDAAKYYDDYIRATVGPEAEVNFPKE